MQPLKAKMMVQLLLLLLLLLLCDCMQTGQVAPYCRQPSWWRVGRQSGPSCWALPAHFGI
jgi:hypothetical protein